MNRRNFIRSLMAGVAAVAVAPLGRLKKKEAWSFVITINPDGTSTFSELNGVHVDAFGRLQVSS